MTNSTSQTNIIVATPIPESLYEAMPEAMRRMAIAHRQDFIQRAIELYIEHIDRAYNGDEFYVFQRALETGIPYMMHELAPVVACARADRNTPAPVASPPKQPPPLRLV